MFPDIHSHGAKTTQIVVETTNPVYNEIFAFRASEAELKEARLVAQVWDYDVADRDDFLGEAIVDPSSFNFQEEPVITAWFHLRMEVGALAGSFQPNYQCLAANPPEFFVIIRKCKLEYEFPNDEFCFRRMKIHFFSSFFSSLVP